MAAESSVTDSAAASLATAMSSLVQDSTMADFTVTCGDKTWKLHSLILASRSSFFHAAIENNMVEKLEMKIDIKDFNPQTMEEVVNYMYGKPIVNSPINFLFEAAERFHMDDLKKDVAKIAKERMTTDNIVELSALAEMYNAEGFFQECADFIVKNDVSLEDLSPKLNKMVICILKENLKEAKTEATKLKNKLRRLVDTPFGDELHSYGCTAKGCRVLFANRVEAVDHMVEYH